MLTWRIGTMGFSWKDWRGPFYPPALKADDYLGYYSRIFNAVEIDATYYGTPRRSVVENWATQAGGDFVICTKAPRLITHDKALIDVAGDLAAFLDVIRALGERLGPVLFQFPPMWTIEKIADLQAFLPLLPKDMKFAVEVRHRSWYVEATAELLSKHQVAWAATEYRKLPMRIYPTADFLYLRFIGQHRRFTRHTAEQIDVSPSLNWWKDQVQPYLKSAGEAYAFFNNDYSGFAPGAASKFKEILGLEVVSYTPPEQGRLF